MEIRYLEIGKGEWLSDVLKRDEREEYKDNAIPTNCIFDKTIPGLGATQSEIEAKRNSIIIEPNIPVILGKTSKNKDILAVFEKQTDKKIENYLTNDNIRFKKILCTPENFTRVQRITNELGINIYEEYFCLFDECEKITQDIDYRENIALPIRDFFLFRNKAFVSATPLEMRNPGFTENGFFKLKILPQFDFYKKLNLIVTNRYDKTVIEKLEELKESKCICVFLNSTNGINKLINHLEGKKINDYKAFCSDKSVIKFKDRNIHNSFEDLNLPLAKYNFFTSRFFSAVDIFSAQKPDIIILTDLNEAKYSKIDPFTNAIQIYGRFRTRFSDGNSFNSLTHITNIDESEKILSQPEIQSYINSAEIIYNSIKNNLSENNDTGRQKLLIDDLSKVSFNRFLNSDGTINFFAVDNFFDDERIKGYYLSAQNLNNAYSETKHFDTNLILKNEPVGDKELLKYKRLQSNIESRKYIVNILDSLYSSVNEISQTEIEYVKNQFRKHEKREKAEIAIYIIDAYEKIGGDAIRNVDFKKTPIDLLLKKYHKEANLNKMKSSEVKEAVKQMFSEKEYQRDKAVEKLQEIFNIYGINEKAKFSTLEKYYSIREFKGKRQGYIRLLGFRPDIEIDWILEFLML